MERVSNRGRITGFVGVVWALLALAACQRAFDNPWDPLNRRIRSVQLLDVQQGNGISRIADTTELILQFDVDPLTLTADHITLTGASKGTLTDQGATKILAISNLTVSDGATVEVHLTSPSGFQISGSPISVVVYRQLVVGMSYGGGIVAYIYQAGDPGYVAGEVHGLIASVNDLSNSTPWYDTTLVVTGATGTALGTGLSNTNTILTVRNTGSFAAKICYDYVNPDTGTGVYDDWFLPSRAELAKLWQNRQVIGNFDENDYYWSSSEYNQNNAYEVKFQNGNPYWNTKNVNRRVRAVRYF